MMEKVYVYLLFLAILVSCNGIENRNENNAQKTNKAVHKISEQQKQELIRSLASVLHEAWRSNRLLADGTYKPRLKNTTDENWINNNNTDEVDIANMSFSELPLDWQEENIAASNVAIHEVISAYEMGICLDSAFIEEASEKVHLEWIARNAEWAQENQKLPYAQLSEEEKDKDRLQVVKAIKVFRKRF